MPSYTTTIEFDIRNDLADDDILDVIVDQLVDLHVSTASSPQGFLEVSITQPSDTLAHATAAALDAVAAVQQQLGTQVVSVTTMTQAERDLRDSWAGDLSVTEVARQLGISRQAVLKKIDNEQLPSKRVGHSFAVPAIAVAPRPLRSQA